MNRLRHERYFDRGALHDEGVNTLGKLSGKGVCPLFPLSGVLGLLMAFIAYGRMVLKPIF